MSSTRPCAQTALQSVDRGAIYSSAESTEVTVFTNEFVMALWRGQSVEQRMGVPAGRNQDTADGEQWPPRVGWLAGELERRVVARGLDVRQCGGVPEAVGVGEQVDVVSDDLLQLRAGLVQLGGPVLGPVLGDRVVVPGVGGDRHPGGVQRPNVVAGEPVRPVQDDG